MRRGVHRSVGPYRKDAAEYSETRQECSWPSDVRSTASEPPARASTDRTCDTAVRHAAVWMARRRQSHEPTGSVLRHRYAKSVAGHGESPDTSQAVPIGTPPTGPMAGSWNLSRPRYT